jgi:hypothetical protein
MHRADAFTPFNLILARARAQHVPAPVTVRTVTPPIENNGRKSSSDAQYCLKSGPHSADSACYTLSIRQIIGVHLSAYRERLRRRRIGPSLNLTLNVVSVERSRVRQPGALFANTLPEEE